MKVFISWSGQRSRAVASAIRDWIPDVIQIAEPWLSSDDITIGMRWADKIVEVLKQADIGIICLTQENLNSPWLMYKAGAIGKLVGESRLCTYLLDLSPADISGPLSRFQHFVAEKDDTYKLIQLINGNKGESLSEERLQRSFETNWPHFEQQLNAIRDVAVGTNHRPSRSLDERVDEILTIVREIKSVGLHSECQSSPQKILVPTVKVNHRSKPRIFIGSSSEGLAVAEALQLGLETVAECTVWNQATIDLAQTTIEGVVDISREYDFAAIILTPDDMLTKRGKTGVAPRDNLLFELGLFTGSLGRAKTFMVYCRDEELSLPSDLLGVTAAVYSRRSDGNIQAALGPVCTRIKRAIGV